MDLLQIKSAGKLEVFQETADFLIGKDFKFINLDITRPWGFYLYIDTEQINKFIDGFYGGVELKGIDTSLPLQPKVLAVEPGKRLSWQYHHRRAEIWRCLSGSYQVVISDTDEETESKLIKPGDVVTIDQGKRHRAIGTDEWGIFAEIWQHTDAKNSSNEEDIVRLQDDYGRS